MFTAYGDADAVPPVNDIVRFARWRRETMGAIANEPHFTIRPDWVCEVLSPSTERYDRGDKVELSRAPACRMRGC